MGEPSVPAKAEDRGGACAPSDRERSGRTERFRRPVETAGVGAVRARRPALWTVPQAARLQRQEPRQEWPVRRGRSYRSSRGNALGGPRRGRSRRARAHGRDRARPPPLRRLGLRGRPRRPAPRRAPHGPADGPRRERRRRQRRQPPAQARRRLQATATAMLWRRCASAPTLFDGQRGPYGPAIRQHQDSRPARGIAECRCPVATLLRLDAGACGQMRRLRPPPPPCRRSPPPRWAAPGG